MQEDMEREQQTKAAHESHQQEQQNYINDHLQRMMHHNAEQGFIVQHFSSGLHSHNQHDETHQPQPHRFALTSDAFPTNNHSFSEANSFTLSGAAYPTSSSNAAEYNKPQELSPRSFSSDTTFTTSSDFTVTNAHTANLQQPADMPRLEKLTAEANISVDVDTSNTVEEGSDSESSEEEDVHQCGRCKKVFHDLKEYVDHKTSKACKTPKVTKKMPTSPVIPIDNQNILVAAAKNTIFRDSFITMSGQPVGTEDDIAGEDEELEKEKIADGDNAETEEGKEGLVLRINKEDGSVELGKRKRIRKPKPFDPDEESLRKAKRKSRPPRRHKPEDGMTDEIHPQEFAAANSLPQDEQGNVILSALDPSGLPTVENIHKYFSMGRGGGRGRGRGRGRTTLHRCPICQLLFPNRPTMIEHKRKHTRLFKCKICNEGFYTEEKLEHHMTRETHSYGCDECERILTSKQALIRHKLTHRAKIHKCDECARAFKTERDLKNHKLGMHSDCRDFVCEVCNKGFSRSEKLKRHLMIHAPDRPIYTCPFKNHVGCDKTFYRKDKLTRHLYSHSKVKPFKCDQCEKTFARTDNLREHIRSHTGIFRYYCTVCGKGQPGPKKFLQHMLKQHNVENAEIPKPFYEVAPEPLIQQHKAVVQAENAARLARAASNMKKEREKSGQKLRKEDLEGQEIQVDPSHVTLATMNSLGLISSPTQAITTEQGLVARSGIETLYSINPHVTSPQFQISRHIPENMVRHISENMLRDSLTNRDTLNQQTLARQIDGETIARHLVDASPHLASETIRRQISETAVAPSRDEQEQQQQQQQQTTQQQQQQQVQQQQQQQQSLPAMTIEAEGNVPVSRGLHLLSQGVLPGSLQFTTLLNSDLVAIGEAVIRNQNGIPTMFQQKFTNQ